MSRSCSEIAPFFASINSSQPRTRSAAAACSPALTSPPTFAFQQSCDGVRQSPERDGHEYEGGSIVAELGIIGYEGTMDDWLNKITRAFTDDDIEKECTPWKTSLRHTPARMVFEHGRLPLNNHVRAEQWSEEEERNEEDPSRYWMDFGCSFDGIPNPWADAPAEFVVAPYLAAQMQEPDHESD